MSDYFVHNSDMFMPSFRPGINAYGQKGSAGSTGDSGSSIYYSALDIANNMASAIELIKNNKMLSSNLYEDCYGTYKSGDLIIDCVGNMFKINIVDKEYTLLSATDGASSIYTSTSPMFKGFAAFCSTSILIISPKRWIRSNPYYTNEKGNGEQEEQYNHRRISRYRDREQEMISGNYVSFYLSPAETMDFSKYITKFVLALPNGQIFETEASQGSTFGILFIDNKYLYGCFDQYENCSIADSYQLPGDKILVLGTEVEYKIDGTIKENIDMFGENEKDVSMLFSYFIKRNCKAYAEVTSIETGKTYRIYVDDIFLTDKDDIMSTDERNYHIGKAEPNVVWNQTSYKKEKWISEYLDSEGKPTITFNRQEAFRPFDQYVFFGDTSTGEDTEDTVDGNILQFFYASLDKTKGFDGYLVDNDFYGDYAQTPTGRYWIEKGTSKTNRVHRLYFKNLTKITLKLWFNTLSVNDQTIYPTCIVYIGVPDCNLVQYGDVEKDGDGEFANIEPGIYYSAKIVPPKVYDPEDTNGGITVPDAGLLTLNINLSDYPIDLEKFHYIDIGITDYGMYEGVIPNAHYPALDPSHYTDIYGEPCVYTSNSTSGFTEIRAYVSGVEEVADQAQIEGTYYPPEMANVDKPSKIRGTE